MTDGSRQPRPLAAVEHGLVALYAERALDRGADPRALVGASRAARWGGDRGPVVTGPSPAARSIGRGTVLHRHAHDSERRPRTRLLDGASRPVAAPWQAPWPPKPARRMAMAGLVALLALPLAALVAGAQEVGGFQARYVVQPGDTLAEVAAEFGVAAEAILASSAVANAPELTPSEVIVIPAPGQTPEDAVADAAARVGTSPYVLGAHTVAEGETLGQIAFWNTVDPIFLAEFNGVADVEDLRPGQRLLIPVSFGLPGPLPVDALGGQTAAEGAPVTLAAETAPGTWAPESESVDAAPEPWAAEPAAAPEEALVWEEAAAEAEVAPAPTLLERVPTYVQRYGLSCEYAAAYIATAAFGNGIDEDVFRANIGQSANPHWGYRGWIDGAWGGTDDYGVYPEAMAPTLQANGFVADVFYAGGDASELTARLDGGMPVAVWLGYFGDTAVTLEDAGTYSVAPGMHVVVASGYDEGGVYASDPGTGSYRYFGWDEFMAMWGVLDGMALGIAPA
jgi:uncharacterized protein YvpB/LysM repeat protein